jgi:replicative DNA helicase
MVYLASLARETPSSANIAHYAQIVRDKSIMRQLITIGTDINNHCFSPEGKSAKEILDLAEQSIFRIAEHGAKNQSGFVSLEKLILAAGEKVNQLFETKGNITGISTGFTDLDDMTSGLQPADLIIVAARPSMGKTTFAMNIAETVAMKGEKAVAVFSMEMPGDSLALRMMSSMGRIDQSKVRSGQLEDEDWPRLSSAMSLLSRAKMYIDDSPGLSPADLRARCRRLMRQDELGLIVIDYLQLMQVPGTKENRTNEISEISRSLKMLAKEMNVPVIALSQLNRSLEQRADRRPVMSDLRESGAIEQDADLIMFIYRDEVYNDNSPDKGIAEIIVGKQRNGPIGKVRLTFLGKYTRFENYIGNDYVGVDYG